MFNETLINSVLREGYTIAVLLICSIYGLKITIEKWITSRAWNEDTIQGLLNEVRKHLANKDLSAAIAECDNYTWKFLFFKGKVPVGSVIKFLFANAGDSKDELEKRAYNRLDKEVAKYEKGLGALATLGSVTPFIGLFGTVIGIIRSFTALSDLSAEKSAGLMAGIAEALIATAAGLFVAIPSVMAYNYFSKKIKLSMPVYEDALYEIIRIIKGRS